MITAAQQAALAKAMDALVFYRSRVHYAELRPMQTIVGPHRVGPLRPALFRRGGITMDCSESVTLLCHHVGLRDPNGRNYDGSGFTGTLLELPRLGALADAKLGDLIVFGPGDGTHVVMVRKPSPSNPVCFSHGTEADPRWFPFAALYSYFRSEFRIRSISGLGLEL